MIISLNKAAEELQKGQLIAIPTETVYGLAGSAVDPQAVAKIYQTKHRPKDNPLICHFYSFNQIREYVPILPKYLEFLVKTFCPGPLTFLLAIEDDSPLLPATTGLLSVACRIPDHPLTLDLLKTLAHPLAAPSANTSGQPSPTNASMVEADLGNKISGILDGGQCRIGLESTIIDCRQADSINILRPGSIGVTELEQALSKNGLSHIQVLAKPHSDSQEVTPGDKYRHYSPLTPLKLINSLEELKLSSNQCLVVSCTEKIRSEIKNVTWIDIGSQQDLEQIAYNLYSKLRSVDSYNSNLAFWLNFQLDNNSSLGLALQNRLDKILKK